MFSHVETKDCPNQSVTVALSKQRAQVILEYIFLGSGASALTFCCYPLLIFPPKTRLEDSFLPQSESVLSIRNFWGLCTHLPCTPLLSTSTPCRCPGTQTRCPCQWRNPSIIPKCWGQNLPLGWEKGISTFKRGGGTTELQRLSDFSLPPTVWRKLPISFYFGVPL